jgi:transcriptional regulator with XRE-family HTH domain
MQGWKIKKSEKPTWKRCMKRQHESGMTKAQFAELIETSPAALSQLLGPNPHRNIGDKMARKIESALDLPFGWMDVLHTSEEPSNVAFRGLNETKEVIL